MAADVPRDLRERLRATYAMKRDDIALVEEAEQLRHFLGNLSADTRAMFYEHLNFLADNDALIHEEVDRWLALYRETYCDTKLKDVRSDIIRELTVWWVAQGRQIAKTLDTQNPKQDGSGDSPVIKFLCAEYKEITGLELKGSTARTELEKLGY